MYLKVFKHLFEHAIGEGMSERKNDHVRDYLQAANCSPATPPSCTRRTLQHLARTRDRERALSRYERSIYGVALPPSS
jgi:hypothetical protein